MKTKGRENIEYGEEFTGEDKPLEEGKIYWHQKYHWASLDIPHVRRTKGGGARVDFTTYSNLMHKAQEIKEASPYRFRHTGDVHRNAHFIGLYILHSMYVHGDGKNDMETIFLDSQNSKDKMERVMIRGAFMNEYDDYVKGINTIDDIVQYVEHVHKKIENSTTKEWFDEFTHSMLESSNELKKAKNKLRMRSARESGIYAID
jgi:hypothetical protein